MALDDESATRDLVSAEIPTPRHPSPSPGTKRRELIRARVDMFRRRMRARCWHGKLDEDAGEIQLIHPDTRMRVARIDVVGLTAFVVPEAEIYRPGIDCMIDLVRRRA